MAPKLFIDTGALIALKLRGDPHHQAAVRFLQEAGRRPRVISSLVLAEAYTWLRYHYGFPAAVTLVEELLEGESLGLYTVVRPERQLEERAMGFIRRYTDVKLSWTDAVSFAILQESGEWEVFGFHEHFRLIGCILVPG